MSFFAILRNLLLLATTGYHIYACRQEDRRTSPPGKVYDIGDCQLHLYGRGQRRPGEPVVILDHSAGGLEGYFLVDELAEIAQVYSYDRAGYGWSTNSPNPRDAQEMMQELESLLGQAQIAPPYILIADSTASYTMRLYAHTYPERVAGLIFTDGLHEQAMGSLTPGLQASRLALTLGCALTTVAAALGLVRIAEMLGLFPVLAPALRRYAPHQLQPVLRSYRRPKHWFTLTRELLGLSRSADQLRELSDPGVLDNLPLISIHAEGPRPLPPWLSFLPGAAAQRLSQSMHQALLGLSRQSLGLSAASGHLVWLGDPEAILEAADRMMRRCSRRA